LLAMAARPEWFGATASKDSSLELAPLCCLAVTAAQNDPPRRRWPADSPTILAYTPWLHILSGRAAGVIMRVPPACHGEGGLRPLIPSA